MQIQSCKSCNEEDNESQFKSKNILFDAGGGVEKNNNNAMTPRAIYGPIQELQNVSFPKDNRIPVSALSLKTWHTCKEWSPGKVVLDIICKLCEGGLVIWEEGCKPSSLSLC